MQHNYHLIPLFSGVINLLLAVFVVGINPRRRLNRTFLIVGIGLAWWNFGSYYISRLHNAAEALFQVRIILLAIVLLPSAFYHFAVETTGDNTRNRNVAIAYLAAACFAILDLTDYFVAGVRPYRDFFRATAGPAFWVFALVYFPVMTVVTLSALIRFLRSTQNTSTRPAKYLLTAVSLIVVSGLHDMLPLLGFDRYPGTDVRIIAWGTLGASLYGLVIGYGVLSDQLLDVRVSISRHAATALRFCFLLGIAYILLLSAGAMFPAAFTRSGLIASLSILFISAVISANFFPKLFGSLSGQIAKGVRGDHFEYQDKVTAFIESARDSNDVQTLIDDATAVIFDQLNLSGIGILIISNDSRTRGNSIRELQFRREWSIALSEESPVLAFFKASGSPYLDTRSDPQYGVDEGAARSALDAAYLELAISIASRPKSPLGFIVIAPRRDGRALTKTDIELLLSLSRSLVFRIERIAIIQNEELRQANKAKDHFLASINHEIRNPLNGISGIVQMLGEHSDDKRSSFLLNTLQACTDQLRSTMDDVLDFTRIESDSVTLTSTEVNLVELVETTCASLDLSGGRIIITGRPSTPVLVRCDAGKVRQVLSNYVANALKYGVPVGGEVTLSVVSVTRDKVVATFAVTTTGPTLGEDEINVLFTALTRGRRARETNAHGTGLGLALCKKLACAMGGTVGVKSAHGKTTFWFKVEFPLVSQIPVLSPLDLARFAGRRALAIEDEPYNRLVLGHYLTRLQVSVAWAESGQAALAAVSAQSFDVILMDWLLPDMDGAELLAKIREQQQLPLPPVLVLSAYSTTSKRAECLAAGAIAFISKPIDIHKLTVAFDQCEFGPMADLEELEKAAAPFVDLASLIALGNDSFVITSFLREVEDGRTRLAAIWRKEPHTAALLVHRLKAQMTLVHAKDCAGLLDVLERALNERWSADDIERLVTNVDISIDQVSGSVRDRGLGSNKPTNEAVIQMKAMAT